MPLADAARDALMSLMARLLRAHWKRAVGPTAALEAQVTAARVLRWALRGQDRRIDVSVPGRHLLEAAPDAVGRLAGRLGRGSVVVTGTNGKTTTTHLVRTIVEAGGARTVSNRAGANMEGGVASELLAAARVGGRMAGHLGVFEVDELWLDRLVPGLTPAALLVTNLAPDQLERYGEVAAITTRWVRLLRRALGGGLLVLCADDPRLLVLDETVPRVLRFGIEDRRAGAGSEPRSFDVTYCPQCGGRFAYDAVFVGHLGLYRCEACGTGRPAPDVWADEIARQGMRGSTFTLHTPAGAARVELPLPGLYNVYNAVGAAALAHSLGIGPHAVAAALAGVGPAFGRTEVVAVGHRQVRLLLVKNAAGLDQVVRTLLEDGRQARDVLFVLHDLADVSWIWDGAIELLVPSIRRSAFAGNRAAELALRLKYAGLDPSSMSVHETTGAGLDAAVGDVGASGVVDVIINYSGLIDLRELLAERGHTGRYWRL